MVPIKFKKSFIAANQFLRDLCLIPTINAHCPLSDSPASKVYINLVY